MEESYATALISATEAALMAGKVLREEFHRLGGPRSQGGHCEADVRAERVIREKLSGDFPSWGYRGEETGYAAPAATDDPLWLVDPNDGTSSYIAGMRGSAVSIGLLRHGVPVLGVVYAFAAPDDHGDLFAWAEGCGPLKRNGVEVAPPAWQEVPGPEDVVLVSQGADKNPEANLRCVAPARYRAVPSIAYRLALAAAGEGVAAVSLNSPGSWDYGAGHALIRGAGGVLVDQDGKPVRYGRRGESITRYCFGGGRAAVSRLGSRDWGSVLVPRVEAREQDLPFPVHLVPGEGMSDPGILARAQGCLLGQLAGDSLGALEEFQSGGTLRRRYPAGLRLLRDGGCWGLLAGQPTDDSELALMLARALVARGGYDDDAVARAYSFWYKSRPFDVGMATRQALSGIQAEVAPAEQARAAASKKTQANGSLMRISPLGIFGHALDPYDLADLARRDSSLTHPHLICREACAVYAVAVARAVGRGGTPEQVYRDTLAWAEDACGDESVLAALKDAERRPPRGLRDPPGLGVDRFSERLLLAASSWRGGRGGGGDGHGGWRHRHQRCHSWGSAGSRPRSRFGASPVAAHGAILPARGEAHSHATSPPLPLLARGLVGAGGEAGRYLL